MLLLNKRLVAVQAILVTGLTIARVFGYINCGGVALLAPLWFPWLLWIIGGILYFPYWYFKRRNTQ